MAPKKERGRFSLRFNIGDPVQRTAVELLEIQPPHSKAQYIANALIYYNAHFFDDPQPLKASVIDRAAIEEIVREIMCQEEQAPDKAVSTGESSPPKKNKITYPIINKIISIKMSLSFKCVIIILLNKININNYTILKKFFHVCLSLL